MKGECKTTSEPGPIEHTGEDRSNEIRRRTLAVEPKCLRTFTPSLAVIERSAGCWHWTADGRRLIDFSSGVLVANLGHNPAGWWRRVFELLGLSSVTVSSFNPEPTATAPGPYLQASTLTAYNAITEIETLACERLLANLRSQPGGGRCEHVLWAASGSEAIQKSLWAALASRPGRDMILATRAGFHGKKGLANAVTGSEKDPDRDPRVRFLTVPLEECATVQRSRQPIDLAPYERELDGLYAEFGNRLGCLITEPYLGGGGSYHPQPEYMQMLESFCRRRDLVFILDEVQSNFGRTGPMYAFTKYRVEPDIVVLGKGLGNGAPVSAAVGRADLFAAMPYGAGSDTFSANPFACAAVIATLEAYESGDVLRHAQKLSAVIEEGLLRLTELPAVAAVRGEGVVWGVECAAIGEQTAAETANRCVEACYLGDDRGRAIHLLGPLSGKVIRVSPPLTTPLEDARDHLAAMHDIVAALK
jgi:4-aminobutyrate aminotransferase-like enzyme